MFGPRLLALIGYFLAARTSRRQLQELLAEVFGIRVCLGALSEAEAKVSAAVAAPVNEAVEHARAQKVKHTDATTWRREGAYAALWTIVTPLCGSHEGCRRHSMGQFACCTRVSSQWPLSVGGWVHDMDREGVDTRASQQERHMRGIRVPSATHVPKPSGRAWPNVPF
jgi:hypothetical protein